MSESLSTLSLKEIAFCDLEREIAATRRVLERLPEEKWDWAPHAKSMDLGRLATHVATLVQWFLRTLETDGIDFNAPPQIASKHGSKVEMLREFEATIGAVRSAMARLTDEALVRDWTIRQGDQVIAVKPRYAALRVWCLSHLVSHRAQLCVYLRLLDVAVPTLYFNSADEPEMVWD